MILQLRHDKILKIYESGVKDPLEIAKGVGVVENERYKIEFFPKE